MIIIYKIQSVVFFLVFAGCTNVILCQVERANAKTDFQKINKVYDETTSISMQISSNFYTNYADVKPYQKLNGYYHKKGNNFRSHIMGIESLQNGKYIVMLDTASELLVVQPPVKVSAKKMMSVDMDSSLAKCSSVKVTEIDKNHRMYRMSFDKGPTNFSVIEVYFNKENYFIDKLVLFSKNAIKLHEDIQDDPLVKPRIEMVYSDLKTNNCNFSADEFAETKYLIVKNGHVSPLARYKDYKFIKSPGII